MTTITEIHKRANDDGRKLIISKEGIIAMSVVSRIGINTSIIPKIRKYFFECLI